MNTDIRRLYVLLCGFEILPKTISTRDRGQDIILSEPVFVYLLDTTRGWVLLDAGMNPANARDPARVEERFGRFGLMPPVIRDTHLLEPQLARIGIGFSDIGHVILSHLHYDHAGQLRDLRHARLSIQRREHASAFSADTGFAYFRDEYDLPDLHWDLRDGDWEAMPGLRLLDTRGHTEGHQSAIVDLPSGNSLILPFDAGDLEENFAEEILPGESCDDAAALAAIRRLKALTTETGGEMLLFHDPVALRHIRLAPEWYD